MKKDITRWSAGGLCLLVAFPVLAADVPQNNGLDAIVKAFKNQTDKWEPIIQELTLTLFWGLVTISLTWCFIQLVLKEGTGLVDVIAELTRRVLLIGFSVWLMKEAPDLARALINSFVEVGTRLSAGKMAFTPSDVLEMGLNIITIAWDKASILEPVNSLMMFISALIILVCFAIMAMEMTILIVSGYIIVSGGIIAMGFLGSEWTRDNAINYFTAVLGVAFKMFVMQLVFFIGYSFISEWGKSIQSGSETISYLAVMGSCIVFAGLIREIPQIAATLATGRFTMQGGGAQAAGMAVAAGAAGAALLAAGATQGGLSNMYDAIKGTGGGGDDSPSGSGGSSAGPRSLDTGPGDDGTGFIASQQARAGSGGGNPDNSDSGEATDSRPREKSGAASMAKGAGRAAGKMTEAALHAIASQTAFGNMLAKGAQKLGEKPVDPSTASAEDVHRQLTAALNTVTQPKPRTPSFDDHITAAEKQHVYEEDQERPEQQHARNDHTA